ncbi:MAG: hypothetical protein Q7S27_02355 [Nanoarchaeota archaeon]|nr:hypothetical protein [Nanoarchaeota archaeon]
MRIIEIKRELSENRNLAGKVNIYSFNISSLPSFSPYPEIVKDITMRALVDKVLDDYAVLAIEKITFFSDKLKGVRQGEPFLEHTQFGIEPASDLETIDKRLYMKLIDELKYLKNDYKFDIKDETKYAQ